MSNNRLPAWRQAMCTNDDSISIDSDVVRANCCCTCCNKPQHVFYLLFGLLIIGAGVVHLLFECNTNDYYSHFWSAGIVILTSLFGFAHNGDYKRKFLTWIYIRLSLICYLTTTATFILQISFATKAVLDLLYMKYASYDSMFQSQVQLSRYVAVDPGVRYQVCLYTNFSIVPTIIISFSSLISGLLVFHRNWIIHWPFTGRLYPFNTPCINPYGHVIISHLIIIISSVIPLIDLQPFNVVPQEYVYFYAIIPIFTAFLSILASIFVIAAMMRPDKPSTNIYALFLTTISICGTGASIGISITALVKIVSGYTTILDSNINMDKSEMESLIQISMISAGLFLSLLSIIFSFTFIGKLSCTANQKNTAQSMLNTPVNIHNGNVTPYHHTANGVNTNMKEY